MARGEFGAGVTSYMNEPDAAKLRFLHSNESLNRVKLETLGKLSTEALKLSLLPGTAGSLKTRPDGTILDGHHRISILIERGEDVNLLPREIMAKDHDS